MIKEVWINLLEGFGTILLKISKCSESDKKFGPFDVSCCGHHIFQEYVGDLIFIRRFTLIVYSVISFQINSFFLRHIIFMIAQKYVSFTYFVMSFYFKSLNVLKKILAQHMSITGKLPCTSWSVTDWTTRHVSEQFSNLDFPCTLSSIFTGPITAHITCDLFFLDRPSTLASDLMTTLHSREAR